MFWSSVVFFGATAAVAQDSVGEKKLERRSPLSDLQIEPARPAPVVQSAQQIDNAIATWRALKGERRPDFETAARFVINYPDFPGTYDDRGRDSIRYRAELALDSSAPADLVIALFREREPQTGRGWAYLAVSYQKAGRQSEAIAAARRAWIHPGLEGLDEAFIQARFWNDFTRDDHEARIDALLFDKRIDQAEKLLSYGDPARRAINEARIALQRNAPDAVQRYDVVRNLVSRDAGLMMDRARYYRATEQVAALRSLLADTHQFTRHPADADRWYEMMLIGAQGAAEDGDWNTAYLIARQVDDAFPAGEDVSFKSYGIRDKYTDLVWLAGTTAYQRLNRPLEAAQLFEKYATGGRSLQVQSKGLYWAARAMLTASQPAEANRLFAAAAEMPELFYSQLSLERLGREIPVPQPMPRGEVSNAARTEFNANPLVGAIARLANSRDEQALFVRALAESLHSRDMRILAAEYAERVARPDLAVWVARASRNDGAAFYYREAYPIHPAGVPAGEIWSIAHGITRQESSFDRSVVSHANAHGMMQIVPATGAEQARKLGLPFATAKLTNDAEFNVTVGSAYLQSLLRYWGGNEPLALASYNGGIGNVQKWVQRYGDPRTSGVDTLSWIEQIPFWETRGYVQRVIENSVVYDRLNASVPAYGAVHVSRHLGKTGRPG